jgi:hypothetical protein
MGQIIVLDMQAHLHQIIIDLRRFFIQSYTQKVVDSRVFVGILDTPTDGISAYTNLILWYYINNYIFNLC